MSTNTSDTLKNSNILNLQNDNVEKVQAMEGFVKGIEGLGIEGVFVDFFVKDHGMKVRSKRQTNLKSKTCPKTNHP